MMLRDLLIASGGVLLLASLWVGADALLRATRARDAAAGRETAEELGCASCATHCGAATNDGDACMRRTG